MVSKERGLQATNRAKLTFGTLHHATHHRLGEAYLAAIVENLPLPTHASVEKFTRQSTDNSGFKERIAQAYAVVDPPDDVQAWCPISREWLRQDYLKAAQIVPVAVGELNAAYIFGVPPEQGWDMLWNTGNGIQMQGSAEEEFDRARLVDILRNEEMTDEARWVIVPCRKEEEGDFKVVVLDETLLNLKVGVKLRYHDIHEQPIEFRTSARPTLKFLYLHCLMAIFRRRRFLVPGWEKDYDTVIKDRIWAIEGDWLRKGVLKALAHEVGDIGLLADGYKEVIGDKNGAKDNLPGERDPEHDKAVALSIRGGWEAHIDQDEWCLLGDELEDL